MSEMFAALREYRLFLSVVCGLAACASPVGGEHGSAGMSAPVVASAAVGGAGRLAANGGTSAVAATDTSIGAVATAGGAPAAAGAGADAAAAGAAGSASSLTAGAGGSAAPGGATFTAVFNLLAGGCASGGYCHASSGGLSKLELVDQTRAYMALVGAPAMGAAMPGAMVMGCATSMILRVKAGDPDNSLLMQKLEGKETCGTEMPPNGTLKPDELKLVRDWIAAGAKND